MIFEVLQYVRDPDYYICRDPKTHRTINVDLVVDNVRILEGKGQTHLVGKWVEIGVLTTYIHIGNGVRVIDPPSGPSTTSNGQTGGGE